MIAPDPSELAERLMDAAGRAGVVGAEVAVSFDGQRSTAVAGSLDAATGAPVTEASRFRMGSIAKTITALALVQLLGAEGRSLDDPVDELLAGHLPPRRGKASITWRHLLTHSSGIDGTFWEGVGDGSDALERYCVHVPELDVVFPAGAAWGYSNSGFVLAGRAIEVLCGEPFDSAIARAVLAPADLTSTAMWTAQPPPHAAVGHRGIAPGSATPVDWPRGLRALAPAGATAFTTADDLLRWADLALATDWQSLAASVVPMPAGGGPAATHQALGWRVFRWGGTLIFGHDGGASGQASFLRWIPATRTGIALLANTAPAAMALWADLSGWVFAEAGVTVPGWIAPSPGASADERDLGDYRCRDATFSIRSIDGRLELGVDGLGGSLSTTVQLGPLGGSVYRTSAPVTDPTRVVSVEQPHGSDRLLHCGPFTARKV